MLLYIITLIIKKAFIIHTSSLGKVLKSLKQVILYHGKKCLNNNYKC